MPPQLGLILTYTPTPAELRRALSLMRADAVKVVTEHGLPGGWSPATIREVASWGVKVVARSPWGDPAYGWPNAKEDYRYPFAGRTVDALAPWYLAEPNTIGELGNEPRLTDDLDIYAYHLEAAITMCRMAYPRMPLLGPAFSLNNPADDPEIARWMRHMAPLYRRCAQSGGGVAIHAYTADQLRRGINLARICVGPDVPIWLTEVNLGEDMPHAERGKHLWALVKDAPVVAALVYHLDQSGEAPRDEQGPARYRVHPDTLAALGLRDEAAPAPAPRPASPSPAPTPPPAAPVIPAGAPPRLGDLAIRDLRPQLPTIKERRPRPRKGAPTSITLHYNGPAVSAMGKPAAEIRHIIVADVPNHQARLNADSLQYHFCVLSDGSVYQTRDLELPAAHCGDATGNAYSLAIHLPLGGTQDATPAQWAATTGLFSALIAEYRMAGRHVVKGHDEWKATLCPGPNLRRRLLAWREGAPLAGGLYRIKADVPAANVREGPGVRFPVALGGKARMWPGDTLDADALVQGEAVGGDPIWLHRRDGVGFVHRSLVEAL